MRPSRNASIRPLSSTTAPRDTLTRIEPGRIRPMRSRLSNPAVCGVSGQLSTMMSASATSSSTVAKRTSSGRLFGLRLLAITWSPNPSRAIAITALPTLPAPITPSVRPASSWVFSACSRPASQPCRRRSRSTMRKRLSSAIVTRNTCSATERALTPGTLATSTPAFVAASIGIMSRPAPCRIAARNFGARSNSCGGRFARTMTTAALLASFASVLASSPVAILRLPASASISAARGCSR